MYSAEAPVSRRCHRTPRPPPPRSPAIRATYAAGLRRLESVGLHLSRHQPDTGALPPH